MEIILGKKIIGRIRQNGDVVPEVNTSEVFHAVNPMKRAIKVGTREKLGYIRAV